MASAAAAKKWERPFHPPGGARAGEAEVGLVHQRRGLERVAGALGPEPASCQHAQLFVHQREQFGCGGRVAGGGGFQDSGQLVQGGSEYIRKWLPRLREAWFGAPENGWVPCGVLLLFPGILRDCGSFPQSSGDLDGLR